MNVGQRDRCTPYRRGEPYLLVRRLLVNNVCSRQTETECQDTALGMRQSSCAWRFPDTYMVVYFHVVAAERV